MKRRIIIPLAFVAITLSLLGQYDERAILFQQAQQLTFQRQFTQAEQAWLNYLAKYSDDQAAIAQLFQLYLQINQTNKAQQLLNNYRNVLSDTARLEYEIQLDIQQAKINDAWDKAQAYLQLYPKDENKYRLLANYFERKGFFEQAMRLYEQGRKTLNKPDAFCLEIANNAFYNHQYEKAIPEYLRFLELQPGNFYFVSNQIRQILEEAPELISKVKTIASASQSLEVKEVYALSLSRLGRLSEALEEYSKLPTEKLSSFAYEQFAAGKDSVAIAAFNALRQREISVIQEGDILLKTAEAYIHLKQYAQAESTLAFIIDPVTHQPQAKFSRKKYPFQAMLLLSDIALWQGKDSRMIEALLKEARQFAISSDDEAEVNYRLVSNYLINERYDDAEQLLTGISASKQPDRYLYYGFLNASCQGKTDVADSLVNELILRVPASPYVNDALTLNIMLMNLSKPAQETFLQAIRQRMAHRDSLSVQTVLNLSLSAKDEELRILAADWAEASGFNAWADAIYDYNWQDGLLREYAQLQRLRLQKQSSSAENIAQDFLRQNPNSVFSPAFRQILQKLPSGRPTF